MSTSFSSIVIGLDLGTSKTGVSILKQIKGGETWQCTHLNVVEAEKVFKYISGEVPVPQRVRRVVVDAPISDEGQSVQSFRPIDRLFMRGQFNNNHVGLQPNNPHLLNIDYNALTKPLNKEWGMAWSDEWGDSSLRTETRVIRETFPNPVLGMLFSPCTLKERRALLRFRFGRGKNVPVVSAAFDLIAERGAPPAFFDILDESNLIDWKWLCCTDSDQTTMGVKRPQGDDLIAALSCALVGAHEVNGTAGYVSVTGEAEADSPAGHYLLPHRKHIHQDWLDELRDLIDEAEFSPHIRHSYGD